MWTWSQMWGMAKEQAALPASPCSHPRNRDSRATWRFTCCLAGAAVSRTRRRGVNGEMPLGRVPCDLRPWPHDPVLDVSTWPPRGDDYVANTFWMIWPGHAVGTIIVRPSSTAAKPPFGCSVGRSPELLRVF